MAMNEEADLRERAVTLRRGGMSRRQIRDELRIWNNGTLNRLLEGEPPPEWTRRPNAKDDLRAKVRELRTEGLTYDEIQEQLGVSRSSVSLWVRDLPRPPRRQCPEQRRRHMEEACWAPRRELRENQRLAAKAAAAQEIGELSDRELFLVGVGLYWAEGSKDKSYSRRERVNFVNSDPDMIRLFLRWLRLLGFDHPQLKFALQIHASADVEAAERFWQQWVGAGSEAFCKTTLKAHAPKTNRLNVGDDYRGCLAVRVLGGAELYRRIEGWWYGIVGAVQPADGTPPEG
ncbi:helix-turn-helix domain-containing protein [Streptacidiphilus sp. N1-3]|uniref:Helix-turn-helix domain-containing protein n=1 Tax=Streptacidiphilus alkalitolerans TaxID=3342712 RepID=A0ABV6XB46_9ACTN